jgi:hypothetical protein
MEHRVMTRYFFNIQDGHISLDEVGSELESLAAAKSEAIKVSCDFLRTGPNTNPLWNGIAWRLWVTDESEETLFAIEYSAVDMVPQAAI